VVRWFFRLLPWAITIGIFVWIGMTTDLPTLLAALQQAHWGLFFGSMIVLFTCTWLVDSAGIWWIYRRYHAPALGYRQVLPVRGSTYVVGILNYAAASAAMAFYFRRRWGVGVIEGGSSLLLLMLMDLGLATLSVAAGVAFLPTGFRSFALTLAGGFALGAVAHLIFWRARWSWGPLEWVRELPQLRGFRQARLQDYVVLGLLRLPMIPIYVGMHVFTLEAFSIHVPLERMLVYVPVQMVLAVLPISVSGLGPGQAAQRLLYTPFAAETLGADALPTIDAYGLALFVGFLVPRLLIGLGTMRAASRDLARGEG
jgi:hypothetical protein